MGYNILRFQQNGNTQWGVLKGDKIAPFGEGVDQLKDILANHLEAAKGLAKSPVTGTINLDAVKVVSPVTRPTRLLCLGLNYYEHRDESQHDRKNKQTVFFRKDESAITGATDDIQWPKGCHLLDYEVELGLVMKKAITGPTEITPDNIGEYVGGMVLVNDISPRDLMFFTPFSQWYMGKSYRTMCPIGPSIYILEEGEAAKIHDMEIKLWVNDDLRQDAHSKHMITKPEKALTLASDTLDLAPGDVLLTGTPGGVAVRAPTKEVQAEHMKLTVQERAKLFITGQLESGRYLKEGDIIRCALKSSDGTIDLGEHRNRVVK
ncbi:MAG: fumarylacetoacetate hydrolase family protein [Saprospiraceae bacterium]